MSDLSDLQQKYAKNRDDLHVINKALQDAQLKTDEGIISTTNDIKNYKKTLLNNNLLYSQYSDAIKDKMQLVATRDRMLQISQERNAYKKKIIYVLVSIIIILLVSIIFGYTIFSNLSKK